MWSNLLDITCLLPQLPSFEYVTFIHSRDNFLESFLKTDAISGMAGDLFSDSLAFLVDLVEVWFE